MTEIIYELVPMEEEAIDRYKLISDGGAKYGEFSIYDLADHIVRIEKQIVELEATSIEVYPTKDIELEQLNIDLAQEKEVANHCIEQFSFELNFEDLLTEIRG